LGTEPDETGIFQICKEILDNGIDEALNGHSSEIGICYDKVTTEILIWDQGRGIPVEVSPDFKKEKLSTLTVVYTQIHAGGKLDSSQKGYARSRGTHGLGACVSNALAKFFQVWTFRSGKWWTQTFAEGKPKTDVVKGKPPTIPGIKKQPTQGTIVKMVPDAKIFGKAKLDIEKLKVWFEVQAYLQGKIKFHLVLNNKLTTYYQPKGLSGFVVECHEEVKSEPVGKIFHVQTPSADVALQWSSYAEEYVYSYVNGSPTLQGGTHVNGAWRALTEALKPYAGARSSKYRPEDLRNGLIGAINVSVNSPQFDSQLKSRLVSKNIAEDIYKELLPEFEKYFATNKSHAKEIIRRANEVRELHSEFQVSKKAAAALSTKSGGKRFISAKLAMSSTKNPKERELFLVEGDSAGGSSKQARDQKFQEVLALRGKVLNVYRDAKGDKTWNNVEILDILRCIGFDPKAKDPYANLRVGKIIALTDPDKDGFHITNLILGMLQKLVPKVFEMGMVYVIDSPLYTVKVGAKQYYGKDLKDLQSKMPKGAKAQDVVRIKGWGEVGPEVLRPVVFWPDERVLTQVKPLDKKSLKRFVALVGEDTGLRKELLGV
jgi:DNA gyrase/topoisomerase IV subunit B